MPRERKFSLEELFKATKELLLIHGYEGFTFSLLAEKLHVSRGTIYKYYENKDELISDYMIDDMNHFLNDLKVIEQYHGFIEQFDFLLNTILERKEINQMILIFAQIPTNTTEKVKQNQEVLFQLHQDMYRYLQSFIELGRKEEKLKSHIPDSLILGFIFQSVAIPNHFGVPHAKWVQSIKEIIKDGMFAHL
jgi:AcrR family transcriptional regulator